MTILEVSLKRDAWLLKDNAAKSTVLYAFQLTDSNGLTYRFVEIVGEADQVEIYAAPFVGDVPLAIYMVPDQVISNTKALLQPLIQSEPAGESVTKAVFVRAYLGMWFFFEEDKMLSDYGYVFTPAQKTQFNKLDSTTWRKLNFGVEGISAIFALYDTQGNAYFFDIQSDGALIKRVPKDKSKSPEYYMASGLDAYQLYLDLLSEYPPKGVLPVVTKAVFTKVEEKADETSEYQLISNLNATQSNALISVLKYSSWTQKVGFPAGGWWFRYKVTTSTGLIYYFGFDYAVVELPDHTERIYTLTPEVMTAISDYFQDLK